MLVCMIFIIIWHISFEILMSWYMIVLSLPGFQSVAEGSLFSNVLQTNLCSFGLNVLINASEAHKCDDFIWGIIAKNLYMLANIVYQNFCYSLISISAPKILYPRSLQLLRRKRTDFSMQLSTPLPDTLGNIVSLVSGKKVIYFRHFHFPSSVTLDSLVELNELRPGVSTKARPSSTCCTIDVKVYGQKCLICFPLSWCILCIAIRPKRIVILLLGLATQLLFEALSEL